MESRNNVLWKFFVEYWDDHILWQQSDRVFINARTVRVLEVLLGKAAVQQAIGFWVNENTVKVLGDLGQLAPDAPYVELLNYVSEPPSSSNGEKP